MKLRLSKPWSTIGFVLAGVGAINWGLAKFVNVDLLSYIPGGDMVQTGAVALITAAGAYVVLQAWDKQV